MGGTDTDHKFLTELANNIASGTIFSEGAARFAEHWGEQRKEVIDIYNMMSGGRGYMHHWMNTVAGVIAWMTDTRDPFQSIHSVRSFGEGHKECFGVPLTSKDMELARDRDPEEVVYEGAEKIAIWGQHSQALIDSLTHCDMQSSPATFFNPPEMDIDIFKAKMYSSITGIELDKDELNHVGERIVNLLRAIQIKREDRTREDDTIPKEPFGANFHGPGYRVNLYGPLLWDKLEAAMDRYYELRGWDKVTGWPTRAKLEELGLKDVANELASIGKLP